MKAARLLPLAAALLLTACGAVPVGEEPVFRLVLEQSESYTTQQSQVETTVGGQVEFLLSPQDGYTLTGTDCPGAQLTRTAEGWLLTLDDVRYSAVIRIEASKSDWSLTYYANGGQRLDGADANEPVRLPVTQSHLRVNTALGSELFSRPGYTLESWNTQPDGSGQRVGLGSRTEPDTTLYAQWAVWTPEEQFQWTEQNGEAVITGYTGSEECLVVPGQLGGMPVVSIKGGAFRNANCTRVILPDSLRTVEVDAFADCAVEQLTLFDNIQTITDHSFSGCTALTTLYVNAREAPVYSGSYYDTFADKFDRLLSLKDSKKLVLFSGSSTRFGYDSALLDRELEDCDVVNMGVFAYTNAYPQLMLIQSCMQEGDILLVAPEFDAAKRQFCTTNELDEDFFCMVESNYDLAAGLDLRRCSGTLSALQSYLQTKAGLTPRSYSISPSDYDEDGQPVDTPSYNEYGDYILYRPNAETDDPIYGLKVGYTVEDFPQWLYIDPANQVYRQFQQAGIYVYMTYSPRNRLCISDESTPEARQELDAYFRRTLVIPIISHLEDSLVPGRYLYGTDNHLSTEGVELRTRQVLKELKTQMSGDGLLQS